MVVDGKNYDLIVIGGGILGLMSAYIAKREHPDWSVIVMDKKLVGNGTTAYSAFLDMPYGKSDYKRKLTDDSRKFFKEIVYPEMHEISIIDKPFFGYGSKEKLTEIEAEITEEFELIDAHDNLKDPIIEAPEDQNCIMCASASYVEYTPVKPLYDKLISLEVILMESVSVQSIISVDGGYEVRTSAFGQFQSKRIIEATGPYMMGKSLLDGTQPIEARVKKIIAFHISGKPKANAPISYFFDDDAFLIPQPNLNRWLFSYRCLDWDIDVDEKSFTIEERNIEDAKEILKKYAPTLTNNIIGGRVFCDLYSKNGDPIVELLRESYVRIGAAGGSGYRLSPGIALEALNLIKK